MWACFKAVLGNSSFMFEVLVSARKLTSPIASLLNKGV